MAFQSREVTDANFNIRYETNSVSVESFFNMSGLCLELRRIDS